MSEQHAQHVAVVTGGASGMGRSICEQLAARGHRVAVLDINGDAAQAVADELRSAGADALACRVDVADRPSVDDALGKVRSELGPVAILVTSAGVTAFEPFTEITLESWRRVLDVNLTGTFHCVQAAIPDMVDARWGRIVTISSSSAQRGTPGMTHYAASKGGVITLTKSLAREFAPYGITVNTIPPSAIDTPMARQSQSVGNLPSREVMAQAIPLGRLGTGDDIAAACVFLCSEGAGYITGQVLGVNGGSVI
ncbi:MULTISPECIES: SDR family NAD(P)-dependent oxidoreductase [unclassified Parafrankia]|uniref:SDR family NAD(P)-dependent oxidoreductase n=1 Tax=unclassified Parafrankia TaxID=2994368 RepID=UPI000DA4D6F7|nr:MULTISPECIES: SDR family NAD(P)-dependent oxidoreductase [unclassified Parafrankia]TCJ32088.1 SDR family oxidoreductase [Parafrankia sp. BMG5.11]SQE00169.1 Short-chain dehydrogenase/reductase SDR [Parafrankia sp. Ea1.12]